MLELGSKIKHKLFGEGEIIYIDERVDWSGNIIHYMDIHFDKDLKYEVRTFTEESLKPFLLEVK